MTSNPNLFRGELFSITALRGLAAVGVVLFHSRVDLWVGWVRLRAAGESVPALDRMAAWLSTPTIFMGSGVMLFFLLSGFCVALPYVGAARRPFQMKDYLIRRLLRIYPPYLAAVILSFGVEKVIAGGGLVSAPSAFWATTFMVQNETTGQIFANPSLWSLPVEVELYLLFPIVLLLLHRWGITGVLLVTGTLSFGALAGSLLGVSWLQINVFIYWLMWTAGALLAEWFQSGRLKHPPVWVLSAAAVLAGVTMFGQIEKAPDPLLHFGYAGVYFVVIWWALTKEATWRRLPLPFSRALVFLGTISFSLYLVHFPFFRLSGHLWAAWAGEKPANFLVPVVFSVLAVGVGAIFYQLIEKPSHQWAKRAAKGRGRVAPLSQPAV